MLARHLSESVLSAAAQNPVVTLMGPRQSGKTTLCQMLFPDHEYSSHPMEQYRVHPIG